jgi:hypothetical protein
MKATLLIFALLLAAPALAEDVDLEVVHRIKQEAFPNSDAPACRRCATLTYVFF